MYSYSTSGDLNSVVSVSEIETRRIEEKTLCRFCIVVVIFFSCPAKTYLGRVLKEK